jgi:hypothetical protein
MENEDELNTSTESIGQRTSRKRRQSQTSKETEDEVEVNASTATIRQRTPRSRKRPRTLEETISSTGETDPEVSNFFFGILYHWNGRSFIRFLLSTQYVVCCLFYTRDDSASTRPRVPGDNVLLSKTPAIGDAR